MRRTRARGGREQEEGGTETGEAHSRELCRRAAREDAKRGDCKSSRVVERGFRFERRLAS